jgi:hypothetical protein
MRISRRFCAACMLGLLLFPASVFAESGMWPMYDLKKLPFDSLRVQGLFLEGNDIYNPDGTCVADAIVQLSGGSASFVSPEGLIVTNHHVALRALQRQSTVERNYIRDGFYAPTKAEEIPAIGFAASVLLAINDVTDIVRSRLDSSLFGTERTLALERITKEIIKEAENGRDVRCRVAMMFGGKQFMLYTYFRIRDIRIVYAPPDAIGNFGGDIDNWIWPRHVGDFSFVRAYVAPDGSSAEFSEDNVPYAPEYYLPISKDGIQEGDFTFIIGYPGTTHRYADYAEVEYLVDEYIPRYLKTSEVILSVFEEVSAADSAAAIRLAGSSSGVSNYYKKYQGMMYGFNRADILTVKRKTREKLQDYIQTDAARQKRFGGLFVTLDSLYASRKETADLDHVLKYLTYACDYLRMAEDIYTWAVEQEKPDIERKPEYQDRDSLNTRKMLERAQLSLVEEADKRLLQYFLFQAVSLPEIHHVDQLDSIFAAVASDSLQIMVDRYVDSLYAHSAVGDLKSRMKMFHMSQAELERLDDPFMRLAITLYPAFQESELREKSFDGAKTRLDPLLIELWAEWKQGILAPDANSTMRFNYGFVEGYRPRDAVWYDYITGFRGVLEKETGEKPFIVPPDVKDVYRYEDWGEYRDSYLDDIPVDFISSNTTTNGNSGSPVLNGSGELIGLGFDIDFEGIAADYIYIPELTRAIFVDARYMLYLIDRVYKLPNLMQELTVQ